MKIVAGKYRGHEAVLHQYANDWMYADIVGGPPAQIVKPTSVQLTTDEEKARFTTDKSTSAGQFFATWQLLDNGRFTRIREPLA